MRWASSTPDNGRSLYTAALFDLRKDNVLTIDTANPDYQIQKGQCDRGT